MIIERLIVEFLMWIIFLKSFIELLSRVAFAYVFVCFFGHEAMGSSSRPEIKPAPSALKVKS